MTSLQKTLPSKSPALLGLKPNEVNALLLPTEITHSY